MSQDGAALEAAGLGMRYGRRKGTVLDGCAFRLPAGRICALVGPNGTGKSTLLKLAAGLLRPAEGTVRVLGGAPAAMRERVAYVAQNKPLHPQLTVAETLRFGAELNPRRWDAGAAERIAYASGLEPGAKIRRLSGGQRTRVALALAVGKRADLMLLDEPMADLDPLARHELAGALLAEATEHGTTVVMSSHVVAELENSCDHLLLLGGGRVRLAGRVDDLLAAHVLLTGRGPDFGPHLVVEQRPTGRGSTALVRSRGALDGDWQVEQPTLEELILAHLRNPAAEPLLTDGTAPAQQGATA
ncbi:ABC transporter ATP-binding protein [Streptomyces sp. DSM 42041]|uniref:ABC transporter ATP-binding protein n=1 Tax=Streptomyces hazeniae TaxID=3075538 RepID=A0ABU2NWZ0_9ACTN|nr:ABC transporter ATP-binding protein [Streptomyces sp. DSM 42041]MDT0380723.1 ABC transporter ATP-binding protein [Streptomyces sp. DSM 42041]